MTATAGTANSADIICVVGASGNGKGLYVKERLRRARGKPILVWSILEKTDRYAEVIGGVTVDSIAKLVEAIKAGKRRIVFLPNRADVKAQFDRFCRVAWELPGWIVVVEELSRVTKASWAPPAWKDLSTAGRHQGLTIIGTAQRPAQIDKDFFGNCTEIRCYAVGYISDAKVMGDTLFIDYREILDLPKFHYLHRDVGAKKNVRGVVKVPNS